MMPDETDLKSLRRAALEIFHAALEEVDAGRALSKRVRLEGSSLTVFDTTYNLETRGTKVYSIAIGKAARSMAVALDNILGGRLVKGIVAAPSEVETKTAEFLQQLISVGQVSAEEAETEMFQNVLRRAIEQGEPAAHSSPLSSRWTVFSGGHPLPDAGSLDAARAAIELLRRADNRDSLILFLISGGGSAIFEWPVDSRIKLEDLREANRVLVSCGATIAEINSVRRAVSAVKGGRLSAFAPRARQISLIVSDTNPGEESTVASGPTHPPPAGAPDALEVIKRYHLEQSLPDTILRAVDEAKHESVAISPAPDVDHHLLLDNRSAIEAARKAAQARGFAVEVAADIIEQPVGHGCAELLARLYHGKAQNKASAFCLISGGEFACPVMGEGTGGRNAETVLRMLLDSEERRRVDQSSGISHTVMLSAGTDGIDGNSPAAGAIGDETTLGRAQSLGLDARRSLEQSDAYSFFHALGDAVVTGPTDTNVRDLRIMLAS